MRVPHALALGAALLSAAVPGPLRAQADADLEHVVLQLRWEYEFQFAGFVAAEELGYYRDAGLDVEIRELGFGGSVYEELTSGRAQYGVGTTDALVARAGGTPVVALAAIHQHSPFVILSRPEAEVRSPEDLVGKRVSVYDLRNTILEAMLHVEGVDPDGFEPVPYDQDYARFVSGEVPVTSAVLTLQPYVFDRMGVPYSVLHPRTYGIDFYGNTLVTLEEEVREHPARVRAFREASLRGWSYALEHPGEVIDLYLERYAPDLDRGLLEFEAAATRELIQPDLIAVGHMNPGRWAHIAEQYRELGVIDATVEMEDFLYDPTRPNDNAALWRLVGLLAGLTLVVTVVAGTLYALNARLKRTEAEKRRKILELERALSEIRSLRDLLPICASCKRIRDDEGFWDHVESYIARHTDTTFTHGICPQCMESLYPELLADAGD